MSDERVTHPSWCDRSKCDAPETRPAQYVPGEVGAHRSAVVELENGRARAHLFQSVTKWDTGVFLLLEIGEEVLTINVGEHGGGFALYELLGKGVGDLVNLWPALYEERFPDLVKKDEGL